MGFRRELFIEDYNIIKCSDQEVFEIKNNYLRSKKYSALAVESLVGYYFSIIADPNPAHNYDVCLINFKRIDTSLYLLLEGFVTSWINFDINEPNSFDTYNSLVLEFYANLKS